MIGANELKRRMMIMVEGEPYHVVEVFFSSPSARGAQMMARTKLRHLLSAALIDKTFKATEKFAEADVETLVARFLYKDANGYCFMEEETFEMHYLSDEHIGDASPYLTAELALKLMKYNGSVASVVLPEYVHLRVIETEHATRQDSSAGSGTKQAVLETGVSARVPIYIKVGDIVRVNTGTGEVVGRT